MFKANSAESEEEFTLQIETSFEELNKKRSKLNNKNRIFAEVRLISGGGASILINVKVVRALFRACSDSINVFFYANCEFSMNFHIFFV